MITDRRKSVISDRREHAHVSLEQRFNEHSDAVERRLSKFFSKSLFIFAVIGVTSATALFGFGVTLSQLKDTRKAFVRDSCRAQNKRHDLAIHKFERASERAIERSPRFAKQIRAGIKDNIDIIDAIAPKQDCIRLSKVAVGEAKPPPPVIPTRRRGVNP